MSLSRWETLRDEAVADCRVFSVRKKLCRHPAREEAGEFFVVDSRDWVNVVAVTTAGDLVMVRQFRFGVEEFSLEIPGGMMDAGEDPVVAASRELQEETGFSGGEARILGCVHPNPAIQSNRCHLVLIDGVEHGGESAWDEHEEIEVVVLPADEVLSMARSGAITHALVLNALWLFDSGRLSASAGV